MNRYDLDGKKYTVHPERLDASEIKQTKTKKSAAKTGKKASAKKAVAVG